MEKLFFLFDWVAEHPVLAAQLVLVSLALAVVYAVGVFFAVIHMSPDYFAHKAPAETTWRRRHPLLRLLFRGLKNVAGGGLVLLGLTMLVLPGQGILTILIGLTFLDFPGKRRLEIWIVQRPSIRAGLDRVRKTAGRPRLILPDS
jgi:hypothetical protein